MYPPAGSGSDDFAGSPELLVLVAKYRDLGMEAAALLHAAAPRLSRHILTAIPAISGAVVLATCNRFEIYCEVSPGPGAGTAVSGVLDALRHCSGVANPQLKSLFDDMTGHSVTDHLMAVASGLDSAVVGEREIAGQVRRALSDAQAAGTASGRLIRLFEAASRTAKDVGARTTLSSAGRSIASVALGLATAGPSRIAVSDASVVLLGTGAYAGCISRMLLNEQCSRISVFSRSGRAEAFVTARGGTALTFMELPGAVAQADIIIGCSGNGARIGKSELDLWRQQAERQLVVIDLAPSHDFDPRVVEVDGVELITLESVQLNAPRADSEAIQEARSLVRQAAGRFEEQQRLRGVDAAIVALRQHVHGVLNAELDRIIRQHGCSGAAEEVKFALRRIVRQFLHAPTVRARELAAAGRQDDYTQALDVLFGISMRPDGLDLPFSQSQGPPVREEAELPPAQAAL